MALIEGVPVQRPPDRRPDTEPVAVLDLRGVGATVWAHRAVIALSTVVCGLLALGICLLLPARYEATARVLLDPRNLQVLQNEVTPAANNGDEAEVFVQSQMQVVKSTQVLSSVVDTLDLARNPAFGSPAPGLVAQLIHMLSGSRAEPVTEDEKQRAMRALDRDLTVRRPDKTFVVEIGVTTDDAAQSATVANTVAKAFLQSIAKARGENVQRSADALDARLAQLRDQLRAREQAVERYRAQAGLVDANGQLVAQQQLTDLNNQLSLAQARLSDQAARLAGVRRLREDGASGDADPATDAQFTALSGLRAAYAAAKRAKAQAATIYGPRYPTSAGLALAVTAARQQLDAEIGRIKRDAQVGYERARASEAALEARVADLKRSVGAADADEVHLRELDREASASRTLYETFLNRARDLEERASLDVVNARVITSAMPPLGRTGLSRTAIVAGGLLIGLLLGLATALALGAPREPVMLSRTRLPARR